MSRIRLSLLALVLLSACASPDKPAPIVDRSVKPAPRIKPAPVRVAVSPVPTPAPKVIVEPGDTYTVKKGDNLFRIALEHGLAYRDLAAWNELTDVNDIKVDQVLRLTSPDEAVKNAPDVPKVVAVPLTTGKPASEPESRIYPKAVRLPYSEQALAAISVQGDGAAVKVNKPVIKPTAVVSSKPQEKVASVVEKRQESDVGERDWILPTTGKVIRSYSDQAKGIDIQGKSGQPVVASSSGKVVYSGSGLQGYGNLVIIKHNKELLSVYAHNRKLLVAEGDTVKKGEKIAEMGNSDADQVKLHFEIRRFGKPVDPTKFINGG